MQICRARPCGSDPGSDCDGSSTWGQQFVVRPPLRAPLPIYLTYSISLHQMVLPPFESVEEEAFLHFFSDGKSRKVACTCYVPLYLLISIRLCRQLTGVIYF